MVWRHSSLPDLGKVGVLAPLESQVGKLLEYLRDPRTPEEIAGRFPGGDPNAAVKKLMAAGIVFKSEGDEAVFVAKGHVQSMARILEVVGRDLQAFGGYLHRDALAHTGANIVERLERVRGELAAIQNALERRRQPYVAEQLEQLGITSDTRGLKLHLGCRSYLMDGWLNIDIQSAPLRLDMNWGLPFGDGAADYIYTSHVIDHVPYKEPVLGLLRDIHRVLARDGTFRVIVPDVEKCIRAYMLGDLDFFEGRTRRWPLAHYWPWQYCRTKLEHFLGYLGLGVPPHDYVRGHRYAYDFETLSMLLNEAGFSDVRRSEYLGSEDANLRVDDSVKGNMYTHGGLHYAMFVEARKGEVH
jgi:SAM-dependent methyltransferase